MLVYYFLPFFFYGFADTLPSTVAACGILKDEFSVKIDLRNSVEKMSTISTSLSGSKTCVLEILWDEVTLSDLKTLAEALTKSNVEELKLSGRIRDSIEMFFPAPEDSSSRHLKKKRINVADDAALAIARVLETTKIESFTLENFNSLSSIGVRTISKSLTRLKRLSLSNNEIGDEGAGIIAEALQSSNLHYLVLKNNGIGDLGAQAISKALPGSKLEILDLKGNRIGNFGIGAIAKILKQAPRLTTLLLEGNGICSSGANAIGEALAGSNLEILNLKANQIGSAGALAIAQGLLFSKLYELDLDSNEIGDNGVKAISEYSANSNLLGLGLGNNGIGIEGAKGLGNALNRSSTLTLLDISGNSIKCEGTVAIANSLRNSQLQYLNIASNEIGDIGAQSIAGAIKNSKLEYLNFNENNFGVISTELLNRALPMSG